MFDGHKNEVMLPQWVKRGLMLRTASIYLMVNLLSVW